MVAQFGSPQGSGVKSSKRSRPAACSTAARMMSAVLSRTSAGRLAFERSGLLLPKHRLEARRRGHAE